MKGKSKALLSILLAFILMFTAACDQGNADTSSAEETSTPAASEVAEEGEQTVESVESEESSEEETTESSEEERSEAAESSEDETEDTVEGTVFESDVLVIGGGGTGLVAALAAAEEDATVILLEKQPAFGGATSMSSGKIPANNTVEQEEAGYEDSPEALFTDIYRAGQYTQNKELLKKATDNAKFIKEWMENYGVVWALETNLIYYGQQTYRIHVAEGSGAGIVNALVASIEENENIIAFNNMEVIELLVKDDKVVGGVVEKDGERIEFRADAVVLATSGFGANREMVEKYTPSIKDAVINVAPGATGDGILWGLELGAETRAMNAYQAYAPISFETHKSIGSGFLDNGAILLNAEGKRFISEYVGYSPLGTAIVNQEGAYAWMIWDNTLHETIYNPDGPISDEELLTADTIEELADLMGVDSTQAALEIQKYQEGIADGEDYFNRTKLPESFDGPYYAVKVTGDFRHTQGGLAIDEETGEVLREDGSVIEGLFAGGGVTEGFSSNGDANYMAGNGLLQAFVYGHVAGTTAGQRTAGEVQVTELADQEEDIAQYAQVTSAVERSDTEYEDGEYMGTGKGHGGDIEVQVIVSNNEISAVEIVNHSETEGISDPAIENLPEQIVQANSYELDVISGATMSSNGILEAVRNALEGGE